MNSIAIIDKHPIVRVGLKYFVAQNFENVKIIESDNLSQFLVNKAVDIPEIFIVGNTMELFNAICQSISEIKRKSHTSQVIIFDESPDHIKIVRSFKAGAKGYLTKFSDMQELFKCVSKAIEGRVYICHDALGLILPNHLSSGSESKKSRPSLSPTEYDVANLLLMGNSISNIEKKMALKAATVRSIKRRIFKKLNITQMIELKESLRRLLDHQEDVVSNI